MIRQILLLTGFLSTACSLSAQNALNMELLGQYNRGDGRASGSWCYTAPDGREYAILGAQTGTSIISLDGELEEVGFVPGYASNWREVIVQGSTAYVVTEGSGAPPHYGMQAINLGQLPDTATLLTTFSETFGRGHIIQKDIFEDSPFVYVCGTSTTDGVHIIDVSTPATPVEVGLYAPGYYIHDCHVRDTLLFGAAFYEGKIDIVSIADKSNPRLIAQIDDPAGNTHSFSTTEDLRYLFVADEQDGLPGRIFDISDLANPREVATWTANVTSLVHNPYIRGDFAFISHNTEGIRVVDLADPEVPVEVGYYDTYSGSSGGFHGLWSACPYLPSGRIIGGNREDGLYLWSFNGARAGRFYAQVIDSLSRAPIVNAQLIVQEEADFLSVDAVGRVNGGYLPGTYTLRANAPGYQAKTISIELLENSREEVVFELASPPVGSREVAREEAVVVFPNPFSGHALIQLGPGSDTAQLLLYHSNGALVRTYLVSSERQISISGNGLKSGGYILTARNSKGELLTVKKIVKQ